MNKVCLNTFWWSIKFVKGWSSYLKRSDGTSTLGVTDRNTQTIYLNERLNGYMLDKVLCHELCHAFCFSYGLMMDIQTEEIVADFLATYGRDVFNVANEILGRFAMIA